MSATALTQLGVARTNQIARLFVGVQTTVRVTNFVRILNRQYSTQPLGLSNGPSRFSPLPRSTTSFGVVYAAEDLATAAYETLIRDRLDVKPQALRILTPARYAGTDAVNLSTAQPLNLLDLTNGNGARYGVPTDVSRYSHHSEGQYFSEFIYRNLGQVDGFLYQSRFTQQLCIAVYDRALQANPKLTAKTPLQLTRPVLASALGPWNVPVQ